MPTTRKTRSSTPAPQRQHRLTMSEIVEQQLAVLASRAGEHSMVEIVRNAKGDVQIKVAVRTGENGIDTIDDASRTAQEIFNYLEHEYPPPIQGADPQSASARTKRQERRASSAQRGKR